MRNLLTELNLLQSAAKLKDYNKASTKKLAKNTLFDYHRKTHMLYGSATKRKPINEKFVNELVDLHDMFVDEILRRGFKHNTPLKKI